MIFRVFVALIGAMVITGGLLLGMDKVTSIFRDQSRERYYRITDVLPTPERGRPDRPEAVRRQPGLSDPGIEVPDDEIGLSVPEALALPGFESPRVGADELLPEPD